jgi:hypothetical protein
MPENNQKPVTNNKITLSTEFSLTLKTIFTIIGTVGSLLWGYHNYFVVDPIKDLKEDNVRMEEKVDFLLKGLSGVGGWSNEDLEESFGDGITSSKNNIQPATKPNNNSQSKRITTQPSSDQP